MAGIVAAQTRDVDDIEGTTRENKLKSFNKRPVEIVHHYDYGGGFEEYGGGGAGALYPSYSGYQYAPYPYPPPYAYPQQYYPYHHDHHDHHDHTSNYPVTQTQSVTQTNNQNVNPNNLG